MTRPGFVHCAPYGCDLEPRACARRFALAALETQRVYLALCRGCPEGAERAAAIDTGETPKNARVLPTFGRGVRA